VKVFISWSGPRSQLLADAVRVWLQDVVQSVVCFASTEDIRAGQRWNNEINASLEATDFGILCVTRENLRSPWLNFEAGALAKRLNNDSRVVPVTLGFSPSALEEPLRQFNGVTADELGMQRLVESVAESANSLMNVEKSFKRWWPDMEEKLLAIPESEDLAALPKPPDATDMLREVMGSLRGLTSEVGGLERTVKRARIAGSSALEIRVMAMLLARNERLRVAVANGSAEAINDLRQRVQVEVGGSPPRSGAPKSIEDYVAELRIDGA
jgi:hypothetical protein